MNENKQLKRDRSEKREAFRREDILHTMDKTYRFSLVHPSTRARKEFDMLLPRQKVLIQYDLSESSLLSLLFFRKRSRYSDLYPEVYVRKEYPPLWRKEEGYPYNRILDLCQIPSDHILTSHSRLNKEEERVLDFAKKYHIHYWVKNMTRDNYLSEYRYNFIGQGKIETTLPKERTEEDGFSLISITPFRYVKKKDIIKFLETRKIPYVSRKEHRVLEEKASHLLDQLEKSYSPFTKANVLKSSRNVYPEKIIGYEKDGKEVSFLSAYEAEGKEKDLLIHKENREKRALDKAKKEHRDLKEDDSFKIF